MKCSPILLILTASLTTFAAGQSLVPTVQAQSVVIVPDYQVRLDWQKAQRGLNGLVIQGRITNTGRKPLVYTQVTPTLLDHAGKELLCTQGHLTVSPVLPGQSAEFRAWEPEGPRFAGVRVTFHEAGRLVAVEPAKPAALARMVRGL